MMMNRQDLNKRIEALRCKGVKFGQKYVQSDLKRNFGQLVSAESEVTVAELVGERLRDWAGIQIHPRYPPITDVDVEIRDQGSIFSIQVKTFEMITSKYGKRMSEAVKNWDADMPAGENTYVARRYVGADLVSEAIRPVAGVKRLARIGTFHFEPSTHDLEQMQEKVIDTLNEAQTQLHYASGIRVILYDVRHSYIDSKTLYLTVNDAMRTSVLVTDTAAVVILTYEFEKGPQANRVLAPIWIASDYGRAMTFFRPPHPIHLVRARPFVIPTHFYHEAGWQNLFAVEKGMIKIDDVPYGPLFDFN